VRRRLASHGCALLLLRATSVLLLCDLGEALEQALVGAATAGGMMPRLADLEAAWLQEASAGAVRVRFTALESELGMPSSASDATLAPPTPPPLAPPSAIVSPNDLSLFSASPAEALLGLAAGSSPKSPGAPTPYRLRLAATSPR
jgi:hypothetical protein